MQKTLMFIDYSNLKILIEAKRYKNYLKYMIENIKMLSISLLPSFHKKNIACIWRVTLNFSPNYRLELSEPSITSKLEGHSRR